MLREGTAKVKRSSPTALVSTIKERCRVCYTCVRECPAKAIRVTDGQAEVIPGRCIGCGHCVRVCSQGAKQVLNCEEGARKVLASRGPVAAVIAPSFAAEFPELDWRVLVGMVRRLGFHLVCEVAFGADLVAQRYAELMQTPMAGHYIATTCPAVVAYVERHQPDLVEFLAPVVSPMVAMARVLRRIDPHTKVVFVGPCIAKKGEILSDLLPGELNAAITFGELREIFARDGVDPATTAPSDFDPPLAGPGALFAISRGLLQAANITEDLIDGRVAVADGPTDFVEALREFKEGDIDSSLLEALACPGCIMGPGMTTTESFFIRKRRVSEYVRHVVTSRDRTAWMDAMNRFADVDLSRSYRIDDQRIPVTVAAERLTAIMASMGKVRPEDELNCGACGYPTCREHAQAIAQGLAEHEMCLPYVIDQLKRAVKDLKVSHGQLASAQQALLQSEKLASMGQLAAGIAHEVNNPLGVVLMYSHILLDEAEKHPELREDLQMVVEQADRCKTIVSGLLHFARGNKVLYQRVRMDDLIRRGLRAAPPPAEIHVDVEVGDGAPDAELDVDQMVQVLTNLLSNSYAAMPDGGTVTLRTWGDADGVAVAVEDTGTGIPADKLGKIFEPFYTTKQVGKGTGLGLAVTYGIVKMHRGRIRVDSNADPSTGPTGTTFTVEVPRWEPNE